MTLPAAPAPALVSAGGGGRGATAIAITLAVILGLCLRWTHLGSQSLWFDEGYTAWMVNHPPAEILRLIRADTSPPLYYLLLHGWVALAGRSELALRAFSAVLGSATIALVGLIAWQTLGSRLATVVAVWLFALSPLQIEFCQEARCYELTAFLTAAAVYGLLRWSAGGGWGWMAAAVGAGIAGLYTHNIMLLYALGLTAAAIVLPSNLPALRRAKALNLAGLAGVMLYLPWLGALASQLRAVDRAFWISPPTLQGFAATLNHLAGVVPMWSWDRFVPGFSSDTAKRATITGLVLALLLAAVALALCDPDRKRRRTMTALALAALLAPILAAIYSCFRTPIFLDKAFLGSTALLPVLLAAPLARLDAWPAPAPPRRLRLAASALPLIFLLASAATVYGVKRESIKENWRGAAAHVAELPPVAHRLILFNANDGQLPFDYYYHPRPGEIESGVPSGFFDLNPPRTMRRVIKAADLAPLQHLLAEQRFDDLLLILSHTGWSDPDGHTEAYLRRVAMPMERWETHDVTVFRFRPGRPAP